MPQPDLAGAFVARLPRLHRHPVGMVETQLIDLLRGHDAFAARDCRAQRVEHRCLAGLGAAGDDDVEAGDHARVEEVRSLQGQRAELDQFAKSGRLDDELADVYRAETAADPIEDDVQPVSGREHRVDERSRDVDPAAGRLEHPLDEVTHIGRSQDRRGQLMATVAGDEDALRLVDPDLLDGGVVEIGLQRPEPRHPRDELVDHALRIVHRTYDAGEAALVVGLDGCGGEPTDSRDIGQRVDAAAAYLLAHVCIEQVDGGPVGPRRCG